MYDKLLIANNRVLIAYGRELFVYNSKLGAVSGAFTMYNKYCFITANAVFFVHTITSATRTISTEGS